MTEQNHIPHFSAPSYTLLNRGRFRNLFEKCLITRPQIQATFQTKVLKYLSELITEDLVTKVGWPFAIGMLSLLYENLSRCSAQEAQKNYTLSEYYRSMVLKNLPAKLVGKALAEIVIKTGRGRGQLRIRTCDPARSHTGYPGDLVQAYCNTFPCTSLL